MFGSLLVTNDVVSQLPADVNPQYYPHEIRRAHPKLGSIYYLDNWPYIAPILVVASPSTTSQATQEHSLPKFPALANFMRGIAGTRDLVSMEGQMWKTWRGMFNPGFSGSHLTSLMPEFVKEVTIFCDILREQADEGGMFPMKNVTDNLTIDIIGKIVL